MPGTAPAPPARSALPGRADAGTGAGQALSSRLIASLVRSYSLVVRRTRVAIPNVGGEELYEAPGGVPAGIREQCRHARPSGPVGSAGVSLQSLL